MGKSVYDIIKKQNGETFARALRDHNLLELPNLTTLVKFAGNIPNPMLIDYLWAQKGETEIKNGTNTNPFELLHQAGYEFVEYADTLEKQNSIKKYFRPNEELCTFHDMNRYRQNYIINAVKYNIDEIKPAEHPDRQDEYGTSVISIQIRKNGGFISIKNRYNHTVAHPDNTFASNPDNIIPGLSAALMAYFKVKWDTTNTILPEGYIRINDYILKYNFETHNIYFGDNFYEKHGQIYEIDKNSQIIIDYFIWDAKEHKLLNPAGTMDCFPEVFNKEIAGKKVTIEGRQPNQSIYANGVLIAQLKGGKLVSLNLPTTQQIGSNFLVHDNNLHTFNAPNVKTVGNNFMYHNDILMNISMPKVEVIGESFLHTNTQLKKLEMPSVRHISDDFLSNNIAIQEIDFPVVETIEDGFLESNVVLKKLSMPNIKTIGCDFMNQHNEFHSFKPGQKKSDIFIIGNRRLRPLARPSTPSPHPQDKTYD